VGAGAPHHSRRLPGRPPVPPAVGLRRAAGIHQRERESRGVREREKVREERENRKEREREEVRERERKSIEERERKEGF